MLKKTIIPVSQIVMPFFSMMTFWLGSEFISPATPMPWLVLYLGLIAYAMALPMLIICYWHKIEQILLLGDALTSHQAYGEQRLALRANAKALIAGAIFAIVIRSLGYGRVGFHYLTLPLAVVLGVLHLVVFGCMAWSLWCLWRYDGLITVRRCAYVDPATGQPHLVYEGWAIDDILNELHVGDDGYALTMAEERDRFLQKYYHNHHES